jgi:hypothetical protein
MRRGGNLNPVPFEHLGEMRTMQELATESGVPIMTLYQRWHRGDRGQYLVRPCGKPRGRRQQPTSTPEHP